MRLANIENVHLFLADSRAFLRQLSDGPLAGKSVFFYLDAHWYADLPLPEEVEWIATQWKRYAVMIDDFHVPGDPAYGFGQYEDGTKLTLDLLARPIARHGLIPYFPTTSGREETGRRKGCVVLTPGPTLAQVGTLRRLDQRAL